MEALGVLFLLDAVLNQTSETKTEGLPLKTPDFIAQDPRLWHEHRRLAGTTIALDGMLLLSCAIRLFRTPRKTDRKPKKGDSPNAQAARCKTWLWILERLYVVDLLFSVLKASLTLWMAHRKDSTSEVMHRAYLHLDALDGFFLSITQAGIVLLLAELDLLLWGEPSDRVEGHGFWFLLNRICHAAGWVMALGVTSIQVGIFFMKQLGAWGFPRSSRSLDLGYDIVSEGMIKILLFFIGFLVFAPYYTVGGAFLWGNLLITTTTWTWRFARVTERKGLDEITPYAVSLIVDFFYVRAPTLFVLVMFTGLLRQMS